MAQNSHLMQEIILYIKYFESAWSKSLKIFANLDKPIHDTMNYSTFTFYFVSGKCEKENGYKKLNILRTKKAF